MKAVSGKDICKALCGLQGTGDQEGKRRRLGQVTDQEPRPAFP